MCDQKCVVTTPSLTHIPWTCHDSCSSGCMLALNSPQKLCFESWLASYCWACSVLLTLCQVVSSFPGEQGSSWVARVSDKWRCTLTLVTHWQNSAMTRKCFMEHKNWHQKQYQKEKVNSQQVRGQDPSTTGHYCGLESSLGTLDFCKHKQYKWGENLPLT